MASGDGIINDSLKQGGEFLVLPAKPAEHHYGRARFHHQIWLVLARDVRGGPSRGMKGGVPMH